MIVKLALLRIKNGTVFRNLPSANANKTLYFFDNEQDSSEDELLSAASLVQMTFQVDRRLMHSPPCLSAFIRKERNLAALPAFKFPQGTLRRS